MTDSIRCRHCNCGHCPVSNTVPKKITFRGITKVVIIRRRICRNCGLPFHTREDYVEPVEEFTEPKPQSIEQRWLEDNLKKNANNKGKQNPYV